MRARTSRADMIVKTHTSSPVGRDQDPATTLTRRRSGSTARRASRLTAASRTAECGARVGSPRARTFIAIQFKAKPYSARRPPPLRRPRLPPTTPSLLPLKFKRNGARGFSQGRDFSHFLLLIHTKHFYCGSVFQMHARGFRAAARPGSAWVHSLPSKRSAERLRHYLRSGFRWSAFGDCTPPVSQQAAGLLALNVSIRTMCQFVLGGPEPATSAWFSITQAPSLTAVNRSARTRVKSTDQEDQSAKDRA